MFLRRPRHILLKEVRRRRQALARHRRRCRRPKSRRNQHLVVGLESLQPVVRSASRRVTLLLLKGRKNLLRHAVVVLVMASDRSSSARLLPKGRKKVERAFVSLIK